MIPSDVAIHSLADASPLRSYDWPARGPAPPGYLRGLAVAFVRMLSMIERPDEGDVELRLRQHGALAFQIATSEQVGHPDTDVLSWYSNELCAAGATMTTNGERLVGVFAILTGLGMRESSGLHCVGADTPRSRGEPTTEENAEAGLFQVSYDAIGENRQRRALFETYRGRTDLADVFASGARCRPHDWHNHGSGTGAAFQETMKNCPFFAILFTAAMLREERSHWGPINKRQVHVRPDAVAFFRTLTRLVYGF
ncbi:MAG TPA: hypothetical protein VH331_16135 [Allosphingosinicella sp.]|jgi:hypothetical protein|nr:hypothetical protein [Allosphingosinicella sp.]